MTELLLLIASLTVAVVIVLIALALGRTTGKAYSIARFTRLKNATIVRPEYEVYANVSPAEFGMIVDGECGRNEIAAEVAYLQAKGLVAIHASNDSAVVQLASGVEPSSSNPIENVLLNAISLGRLPEPDLFKQAVLASLQADGWIFERRRSKVKPPVPVLLSWKFIVQNTSPFSRWLICGLFVTVGAPLIGLIVSMVSGGWGQDIFLYMGVNSIVGLYLTCLAWGAITTPMLSPVILLGWSIVVGVMYIMRGGFKDTSVVARNYSPQYKNSYDEMIGLRQYLTVSGMDTMTPDYTTLDFRTLDKLYPYAVALGMDKRLIELLKL